MTVVLKIRRFNPETDGEPYFKRYTVAVEPADRVLDALMDAKRNLDGSLAFRKSCAHGVCGSDAMLINGKERLACKTLIRDVAEKEGAEITIEPLKHQRLQRDLMVDQGPFFERYRSVKPYLLARKDTAEREILQSQEERALFDDPTKCILCSACFSACPVLDKNARFLGPAALVQAARFVNDSRDQGLDPRVSVLDTKSGVWPCENHFECTRACPKEIPITKSINTIKREIQKELKEER